MSSTVVVIKHATEPLSRKLTIALDKLFHINSRTSEPSPISDREVKIRRFNDLKVSQFETLLGLPGVQQSKMQLSEKKGSAK